MSVQSNRLAERIVRHLFTQGLDDVFIEPLFSKCIETDIIRNKDVWKQLVTRCRKTIENPSMWTVGNSYKFSIPKSPYAYRNVDWIDLGDAVSFAGLVFAIAPTIEADRIPVTEEIVFSNRYSDFGRLMNRNYNFKAFKQKSRILSKVGGYKVKINTDISNFYDRLNLHRLETSLISSGCSQQHVSCLNKLLIFWANRNSYGLPVGCDASRILAEAALIPVDKALHREGIKFIRYVDDYRIFANSFSEAHAYLHTLIQLLDKESLFINTSKTTFIDLHYHPDEIEEAQDRPAFEKIDEATKIEESHSFKIGYATRIIKTYRFPGRDQIKKLQSEDLRKLRDEVIGSPFDISEERIRYYIKCFIYGNRSNLNDIIYIVERYLHHLVYIVDALIKEEARFSDAEAQIISRKFCEIYDTNKRSPFYDLTIVRLLCSGRYQNLEFIRRVFKNLTIETNPLFLQEFILKTMSIADRELLLSYRNIYASNSLPVRRAIFHAIDKSSKIIDGEKKAWFKQVVNSEPDQFLKANAGRRLSDR